MNTRQLKTFFDKWFRRSWPTDTTVPSEKVSVVFVNYNTLELTSYLLFTLFRVVGRENLSRIIAVDNNSNDGSKQLLELFAEQEMLELISNVKQNYHGPAINQALNQLAKAPEETRYIWVLDSDIVILNPDVIKDSVCFLEQHQAAAIGQYQFDALPEGYAHISSLLIDPTKCWQRKISPFDNTGAPAANLQTSLRDNGLMVADFPYRGKHYVLHLARGTLKSISEQEDKENIYYDWATTHADHHYHGDPQGPQLHARFMDVFTAEVAELSPKAVLNACKRQERLQIKI